jgi:hypothetical protein
MEGRENLRDKEAEVPWLDASSRRPTYGSLMDTMCFMRVMAPFDNRYLKFLGRFFLAIHEMGLKELVLIGRLLSQREVTIMYDLKRSDNRKSLCKLMEQQSGIIRGIYMHKAIGKMQENDITFPTDIVIHHIP